MDDISRDPVKLAIAISYIVLAMMWIIVVVYIYNKTKSMWYILMGLLPFIPTMLILYNLNSLDTDDEDVIIRPSTLSMGFILGYALLNQMRSTAVEYRTLATQLMMGAIITSLLSVPEYYFGKKYKSLVQHVKLNLQSFSAALFIMTILVYFTDKNGHIRSDVLEYKS